MVTEATGIPELCCAWSKKMISCHNLNSKSLPKKRTRGSPVALDLLYIGTPAPPKPMTAREKRPLYRTTFLLRNSFLRTLSVLPPSIALVLVDCGVGDIFYQSGQRSSLSGIFCHELAVEIFEVLEHRFNIRLGCLTAQHLLN